MSNVFQLRVDGLFAGESDDRDEIMILACDFEGKEVELLEIQLFSGAIYH